MDASAMRSHLEEARVARLTTADADGKPHIVPITFAVNQDTVFFAVDTKPKRTRDLKRLRNLAANPSVALLIDHYDEDWSRLWWPEGGGRRWRTLRGPPASPGRPFTAISSRARRFSRHSRWRLSRAPGIASLPPRWRWSAPRV